MPIQYKIRRGPASTANSVTLTEGELYMDTTNKNVRIHDGVTVGGTKLLTQSDLASVDLSGKVDKINITAGTVGSGSAIPIITYNAQGQITSVSTSALNIPANIATESYVNTQISGLVNSAPATLDTLKELATALGNDSNFSTTITNSLATKQSTLVSGTNIKTINNTSVLGSGNITIPTFSGNYNDLTNKPTDSPSVTFDTGISTTQYTGIKLKNNFFTATLGNNIPNSYNNTLFVHLDWLNTGTPTKTPIAIDGQTGKIGINKQYSSEQLDVEGNVKATAFIGDGSQLTNVNPLTKVFAVSPGWQQTVSIANYTSGEQESLFSYTFTPPKTGYMKITYKPKDFYAFTSIGVLLFALRANSPTLGGSQVISDWVKDNITYGSNPHGPYSGIISVTANEPVTLKMSWLLQSVSGSNYFNYSGNGMTSLFTFEYVNKVSSISQL